MSNEMPKEYVQKHSLGDLAQDDTQLNEIKYINELAKQNIKKAENEKILDDTEVLKENAKIINDLGRFLVRLFFGKYQYKKFTIYFIFFWIIAYISFNIYVYECLDEKYDFYIKLVDKIGLFLIVCVLGKFLKDSISNIIKILKR